MGECLVKVVILAGGLGSRLGRLTEDIPKPMVRLCNGTPIIQNIINHYKKFNNNFEFIVSGGYKCEVLINYFKNTDIKVINTGLETQTGGRIKLLKDIIGNNSFLFTYGDGLSDIDINKLINFHNNHSGLVTVSAVKPPARFGCLNFNRQGMVTSFIEKERKNEQYINGGYFVAEKEIFSYIESDLIPFEKDPMTKLTEEYKLYSYRHDSFWKCIDTESDVNLINQMIKEGNTPWM